MITKETRFHQSVGMKTLRPMNKSLISFQTETFAFIQT